MTQTIETRVSQLRLQVEKLADPDITYESMLIITDKIISSTILLEHAIEEAQENDQTIS